LAVGWSNVSQNAGFASPQAPDVGGGGGAVVVVVCGTVVVVGAMVVVVGATVVDVVDVVVVGFGAHSSVSESAATFVFDSAFGQVTPSCESAAILNVPAFDWAKTPVE
jgi:hypothetical protein